MPNHQPKCTQTECEQKREGFLNLSEDSMFIQMEACESCEEQLFKDNAVTNETYQIISILWAERHNKLVGREA